MAAKPGVRKRMAPNKSSKTKAGRPASRKRGEVLQPSYRTGRETQESIVAAAETVLVRFGHAGFTLKRVADCAGIAVGNLSYHFPTKDSLLELLIDQTLKKYASRFATLIPKDPASSAGTLGDLVGWFMDDSVTTRYTHLFRELWAAALHSPPLNAALDRFYDESIEDVVAVMAPAIDADSRANLRNIVYLMCIISEGSSVVFGSRDHPSQTFSELKAITGRLFAFLGTDLLHRAG